MKPDWCPPEIWSKAYSISEAAKAECVERGLFLGTGNALDVYDHHIARALLEAERRGMERAAEIAESFRDDNPKPTVYAAIAAAIRAAAREIKP